VAGGSSFHGESEIVSGCGSGSVGADRVAWLARILQGRAGSAGFRGVAAAASAHSACENCGRDVVRGFSAPVGRNPAVMAYALEWTEW
jgi:hypothetical protein